MTTASSNKVFEDLFAISDIDKDGKKFDRGAHNHKWSASVNNSLKSRAYSRIHPILTWT